MRNRKVLITLVFFLLCLAAVITISMIACHSQPATVTVNTCVSCHTDEARIQELTVSIEPHKKSALISGEC